MTNPLRLLLWTSAITVTIAALEFGQTFVGPVVTALVFGIILSPLVNWFEGLGVRPAASSFVSVLIGVACAAAVVVFTEPYVARAIEMAPRIWFEIRSEVQELRAMLLGLDEMVERVESTVNPEGKGGENETPAIDVPTARDALVFAPRLLGQMLTFVGVLYFFLMTRPEIFAWLGRMVGELSAEDFAFAEKRVARYFLTITAINAGFGLCVAVAMQILGLPMAIMWGIAGFLANFIIYLGPMAVTAGLVIAGLVTFDGAMSFVPAAVFFGMNAAEGQFVTPHLVGRQMSVNPLLVFLSIVFWMWLWGPLGGFIAIPILVWSLALADRLEERGVSSSRSA